MWFDQITGQHTATMKGMMDCIKELSSTMMAHLTFTSRKGSCQIMIQYTRVKGGSVIDSLFLLGLETTYKSITMEFFLSYI